MKDRAESLSVLVTGGAGFLGSHLVEEFVENGFKARVLDDFSSGKENNLRNVKGSVEVLRGDVANVRDVMEAMDGVNAVVHLAAKIDAAESFKKPRLYNEVNVNGTLNVLNACVKKSVKKLIYVSTCAVYGEPLSLPITEAHPANPPSPYAASKLAAEAYAKAYANAFGLDLTILRLFNAYGPRQLGSPYAGVIARFIGNLKKGEPPVIFGDGEQTRDFVYVKDVVEAIARLLKTEGRGEIFNLGSGSAVSINELARSIMNIMGVEGVEPIRAAPRPGDVNRSQADISRIAKAIGFKPKTSLNEGLKLTIKSVKA